MPTSKEFFKDLEHIEVVNKEMVRKQNEKSHKDTTPRRRAVLEKEIKDLREEREQLKVKLNNYHKSDKK